MHQDFLFSHSYINLDSSTSTKINEECPGFPNTTAKSYKVRCRRISYKKSPFPWYIKEFSKKIISHFLKESRRFWLEPDGSKSSLRIFFLRIRLVSTIWWISNRKVWCKMGFWNWNLRRCTSRAIVTNGSKVIGNQRLRPSKDYSGTFRSK